MNRLAFFLIFAFAGIAASDAGKRIFLGVDGAMSYAAVWLNGKLAGGLISRLACWNNQNHG